MVLEVIWGELISKSPSRTDILILCRPHSGEEVLPENRMVENICGNGAVGRSCASLHSSP